MSGIVAKIKIFFLSLLILLLLIVVGLVWLVITHPQVAEVLFHAVTGRGTLEPLGILQEQGRSLLEIARDKLPF